MKPLIRTVLLGVLLLAGAAQAQITDIESAINKAGRERMLSQRMAKAYFQIGQQLEVERSQKTLDASVAQFDRQLVELKHYAPTPALRETYQRLEQSWLAYKDLLVGRAPSKAQAGQVLALSEQVLALAMAGTDQLEKHAGSQTGRLVNLAGRQRMLSQRMAKLYQAQAWGVAAPNTAAELTQARKQFAAAQQELMDAAAGQPRLREGLELVRQQWLFFDSALNQPPSPEARSALLAVASTSERILAEMEAVVTLFERQGR